VQDVAVEVFFGKDHPVDSSEAAFKTAGRQAFKLAFRQARPVLLEPIVNLEVTAPSKYTGAILGDLNTKRARIESQDSLAGDLAVITGRSHGPPLNVGTAIPNLDLCSSGRVEHLPGGGHAGAAVQEHQWSGGPFRV